MKSAITFVQINSFSNRKKIANNLIKYHGYYQCQILLKRLQITDRTKWLHLIGFYQHFLLSIKKVLVSSLCLKLTGVHSKVLQKLFYLFTNKVHCKHILDITSVTIKCLPVKVIYAGHYAYFCRAVLFCTHCSANTYTVFHF